MTDPPRHREIQKIIETGEDIDSEARQTYIDNGNHIVEALRRFGPALKSKIGDQADLRELQLSEHLDRLIEQR